MAITSTTLSADISASDLTLSVASGSGFPTAGAKPMSLGYLVRIDHEYMYAYQQPVSGQILVRSRGAEGTAAQPHDLLSKVLVSSNPQDFMQTQPGADNILPPWTDTQQTIGEDITFTSAQIAAITQNTIFAVTKATPAAIVLVAPSKAQDGLQVQFTSLTAAAHVITATTLLGDGASGSPHTTATFAAYIGAGVTLEAQNGIWNVIANVGVTIT